jgi:hypothetical protein
VGRGMMFLTKPFPNLVTMIPIFMNGGGSPTHYIGLQSNLYYADHIDHNFLVSDPKITQKDSFQYEPFDYSAFDSDSRTLLDSVDSMSYMGSAQAPSILWPIASNPIYSKAMTAACNLSDKMVGVLSIRGVFMHISSTACHAILEFNPDSMIGINISEYLHAADRIHFMRQLKLASIGDSKVDVNCRFKNCLSSYIHVNIMGKIANVKSQRCFILTIQPIVFADVSISSFLVISTGSEFFLKLSPQLLILYCSEGLETGFDFKGIGRRLLDLFKFSESEGDILELIKNSLVTQLECEVNTKAINIRFLKTNDLRGSTLIAQLFTTISLEDKLDTYFCDESIYGYLADSPVSLFHEVTTIANSNKAMKNQIGLLQKALTYLDLS